MKNETWGLMKENVKECFVTIEGRNFLNKIVKNHIFYILGLTIWTLAIIQWRTPYKVNGWLTGGKKVVSKQTREKNMKYIEFLQINKKVTGNPIE